MEIKSIILFFLPSYFRLELYTIQQKRFVSINILLLYSMLHLNDYNTQHGSVWHLRQIYDLTLAYCCNTHSYILFLLLEQHVLVAFNAFSYIYHLFSCAMECTCATWPSSKYYHGYKHTDQANNFKSDKGTMTLEAPTVSQSALTDRQPAALLGRCLWGPGNSWDGKKVGGEEGWKEGGRMKWATGDKNLSWH